MPRQRLAEREGRDVLVRVVQDRRERIVLAFRPDRVKVLIGPPAEQQGTALGHALAHLRRHHLVVVRDSPAAVRESAARVLVGAARRLHHAVERQVAHDRDLHFAMLSKIRPAISVAALKSCCSRFFMIPNVIPVAVSKPAKLPPTPPTPNAVGGSFGSRPTTPTE